MSDAAEPVTIYDAWTCERRPATQEDMDKLFARAGEISELRMGMAQLISRAVGVGVELMSHEAMVEQILTDLLMIGPSSTPLPKGCDRYSYAVLPGHRSTVRLKIRDMLVGIGEALATKGVSILRPIWTIRTVPGHPGVVIEFCANPDKVAVYEAQRDEAIGWLPHQPRFE